MAAILSGLVMGPNHAAAAAPYFSMAEFPGLKSGSNPNQIAKGPDGNMWFTELNGGPTGTGAIGRITPTGVVTEFATGISPGSNPSAIVAGSDGNMWFTEFNGNRVAKIAPGGGNVVTEYSSGITGSQIGGIAAGPDGALWFVESAGAAGSAGTIGRITTSGAVTEYQMTSSTSGQPSAITAGSDGNLWVTEQGGNGGIARILSAAPNTITEFTVPTTDSLNLVSITSGSDGNLWFPNSRLPSIWRLSPSAPNPFTKFTSGLSGKPVYIGAGPTPDGNVWFTENQINGSGVGAVGRITTASPNAITEYPVGNVSPLNGIAAGPSDTLWFADATGQAERIGRVALQQPPLSTQASSPPDGGGALTDTATLTGLANPTGTISFRLFGPADPSCTGTPLATSTVTVNGDASYTSPGSTQSAPGYYRWEARYSGDTANAAIGFTPCGESTETAPLRAITSITAHARFQGDEGKPDDMIDSVVVNGTVPGQSGVATIKLYGPADPTCSGTPLYTATSDVGASGFSSPTTAGTYRWVASYSGDSLDAPVAATACGAPSQTIVVKANNTVLSGLAAVAPDGHTLTDTATLAAGASPTGTITFSLYRAALQNTTGQLGACNASAFAPFLFGPQSPDPVAIFTSTKPVTGDGSYASAAFSPSAGGPYQWIVSYSGDSANNPNNTYCGDGNQQPTVVHNAVADFDQDGKTDLTVYSTAPYSPQPGNGVWYTKNSASNTPFSATAWGQDSGDIPVPADYLGLGVVQDAVFRPSTGVWFILNPGGGYTATTWGQSGDIPVPADYEGVGKSDIAVFRPSTGAWFVLKQDSSYTVTVWGAPGGNDIPVPADYEGIGKADIAAFRPSTGTWFVLKQDSSYTATRWGQPGDVPVPADYEGVYKADIAIFRPSTGTWFVLKQDASYVATIWGHSGDIPQPGDYNGDGKADIAVYRPGSSGTWYVLPSDGSPYTATVWGTTGDIPVVLPYAIRGAVP